MSRDIITFNSDIEKGTLKQELLPILKCKDAKVSLKNLPTEYIIYALDLFLSDSNNINQVFISNLVNLIKTYNSLDDSFFNNPLVFIKDLDQFIEIRILMKDKLEEVSKELASKFISLLCSYDKNFFSPMDTVKTLSPLYAQIFEQYDFQTLCGILSTSGMEKMPDYYIEDSAYYINCLLINKTISLNLINLFAEKLKGTENG